MEAQFYNFDGDSRVIDKELRNATAIKQIAPYRAVNDLRGFIIVSSELQSFDYVRLVIAGKSKYYFVVGKTIDTAGRLEMQLSEDVLMTWSDYIKQQTALILRTFAYGNDFLPADYPALAYSKISHHSSSSLDYGSATAAPDFVLVTAGRGYEAQSIKDAMTTSIPVN